MLLSMKPEDGILIDRCFWVSADVDKMYLAGFILTAFMQKKRFPNSIKAWRRGNPFCSRRQIARIAVRSSDQFVLVGARQVITRLGIAWV